MEAYAGTSAPFNFNGLVRHYFLRNQARNGRCDDHAAAQGRSRAFQPSSRGRLREKLKAIKLPAGAVKVVETPPGPPVMATLLAEIYGPDEATRQKTAAEVEKIFRSVPYIVDTDNSFGQPRPTLRLVPDRAGARSLRTVRTHHQFDSIGALLGSQTVGYAPRGGGRNPLPIEQPAAIGAQLVARRWPQPRSPQSPARALVAGRTGRYGAMEKGGQLHLPPRWARCDMVMAELAGRL
jgi:hypothetical protein